MKRLAPPPFRSRLASGVFALVASLACLSAVLLVFASASQEFDPVMAKAQVAPAASVVASAPRKPARS